MTAGPTAPAMGREYDRRLMPRLFVRSFLAVANLASAWALVRGRPVPLLAGVSPEILGPMAWTLATVHGAVGVGLVVPPIRRAAVAALLASLLGWMAFLGATSRYAPAFIVGGLVMLTLGAAPPEDEGVWRRRERGFLAEGAWLFAVLSLAILARWTLRSGWLAWTLVPLTGAVLHVRALARLRAPQHFGQVGLRWGALFGIAPVGLWYSLQGGGPIYLLVAVAGLMVFWAGRPGAGPPAPRSEHDRSEGTGQPGGGRPD